VRILRCESESMSSYSMPPDLKFEDIINGILAFSKSLISQNFSSILTALKGVQVVKSDYRFFTH
jgi:hypothetical protein